MKLFNLTIIFLLAATSCAPILGASHHHPQEIWNARTVGWDKDTILPLDKPPVIPQVTSDNYVIIRVFEDEILAPTGVYLSAEEKAFTPTTEMYYTPQMSLKIFDYFFQWMIGAGARAYQQYDHAWPEICKNQNEVPDVRILDVHISGAELHRWLYQKGLVADLTRITYTYEWTGCDGHIWHRSTSITHDLLTASHDDELDMVAGLMAKEVLSTL